VSLCTVCDGEGKLHKPKCLSLETFDVLDCNCDTSKCNYCKGLGRKEKRKGDLDATKESTKKLFKKAEK
jgi:hypothetical protein